MSDQSERKGAHSSDSLDSKVAIQASLQQSGLTLVARSRAIAALDRLVGGFAGVPAAWLERYRAKVELESRHQREVDEIRQDGELSRLRAGLKVEQAALDQRVADDIRKYQNKEAVSVEAILALGQIPTNKVKAEHEAATVDQDWMNYFASYAEKASADSVRQIWGRILAGQIVEPGKFSLTALRILAELDPVTSANFQEAVRHRVSANQILPPEPLEGDDLMNIVAIETAGLIGSAGAPLYNRFSESFSKWWMDFGTFALVAYDIPSDVLGWQNIPITSAGQQIASILPWDQEAAARRLASRLRGTFKIELHIITDRREGGFRTILKEVLREVQ